MPFSEIGVPEFFASRIEVGDNNGDGTFRLWFAVDHAAPLGMIGEHAAGHPVASVVIPARGVRAFLDEMTKCFGRSIASYTEVRTDEDDTG